MNKDLQNKNGHQEDFFSINSDDGWKQMAALLDAEMPVKKKRAAWPGVLRVMMAASFLLAVFTTSDSWLNKPYSTGQNSGEELAANNETSNSQSSSVTRTYTTHSNDIDRTSAGNSLVIPTKQTTAYKNNFTSSEIHGADLLENYKEVGAQTAKTEVLNGSGVSSGFEQTLDEERHAFSAKNEGATATTKSLDSITPNTAVKAEIADQKKKTRLFEWYGGVQLQQGLTTAKSFTVAPYAQAQYNIGKKWYATVGLGLYAGNGNTEAKNVVEEDLNDFANNIKTYATITNYVKMRYLDVPVQVGLKLNSHFSVQAGLQTSFLLKTRKNVSYEVYDFRMTSSTSIRPPNTLGLPVTQPEVKPNSIDVRYVAGIRYNTGRITGQLQYQHGLKPIMESSSFSSVSSAKTQTINLQLLYRF
jgi:hypothetical protein